MPSRATPVMNRHSRSTIEGLYWPTSFVVSRPGSDQGTVSWSHRSLVWLSWLVVSRNLDSS